MFGVAKYNMMKKNTRNEFGIGRLGQFMGARCPHG